MPDYTTKVIFDMEVRAAQATAEINRLRQAMNALATAGTTTAGGGAAAAGGLYQQITGQATATEIALAKTAVDMQKGISGISQIVQQAEIQYFGLRRLSYGLQSTGRDFTNAGMSIIRTMQGMADQYLDFADAATRAGIAMELPIEMQGKLRDSVQDTSEVLGAFDANQILETMRVWVAGTGEAIDTEERLNVAIKNTTEIMRLAAINNVDAAKTVEYVGSAMTQFGLTQADVTDIVASFNFVAAKTFANVNDIGEAVKYVGPIVHKYGATLAETTTMLGFLADAGIKASMAGTSFRQIMVSITDPTEAAKDAFNELFRTVDDGWKAFIWPEGEFINILELFDLLAAAMEGFTTEQKAAMLGTLFTTRALTSALVFLGEAEKGRAANINTMRAAHNEQIGNIDAEVLAWKKLEETITGIPQQVVDAVTLWTKTMTDFLAGDKARAENLRNQWKNALTDLGAIVFEKGIGPLEDLIEILDDLAEMIERNDWTVQVLIGTAGLSLAIGGVTTLAGTLLGIIASLAVIKAGWPAAWAALGAGAALLPVQAVGAVVGAGTVAYLRREREALTAQFLEERLTIPELEEYAGLGAVSGVLAQAAEDAISILREGIQNLPPILKEWPEPPVWDWEAAARTAKEAALLGKYGPEELPGVIPAFEKIIPLPTLDELEKKYGAILDAYDKYLEQIEDKQEAFDKRTLTMEEDHQEDLLDLAEQRVEGRIDLIDTYEGRVEDVWRSYYRSMEMAERDHQERMLDIVEDGLSLIHI